MFVPEEGMSMAIAKFANERNNKDLLKDGVQKGEICFVNGEGKDTPAVFISNGGE